MLALQLPKLQGALTVIAVDRDAGRASFAQKLGAGAAFGLSDKLPEEIRQACTPSGPAVVILATGAPQPILLAFQLARKLGRVILLGSTRGETEHMNFYRDVHQKGLTMIPPRS